MPTLKPTIILLLSLVLGACSGGGGDDANTDVTSVDAGADQVVVESSMVTLAGAGTTASGTLTYTWTQTGGPPVALTNADSPTATFMAPDVAAPVNLVFQLMVNDGTTTLVDTVTITVQEPQPVVTVSGLANYEYVPALPNCRDLDFSATETRRIRGATIQILDAATDTVISAAVLSSSGTYSISDVPANTMVYLRVRAELKQSGAPGWDIEIRDNFLPGESDSDTPPPEPQGSRALYVLDGSPFNSGATNSIRNLTADSGWTGSGYNGPRAAAPFAILDAIYSGIQLVLSADANAVFPPMDAFWSANNTLGSTFDVAAGEFPSSFYSSSADSLYLLGDPATDTEEFDSHVVMHEWGHYFEDNFSRSDSIGGPHSLGQSIDARLAWGEGWATAFAAMALDDPLYCDTRAVGSNSGFSIDTESDSFGVQGWFNEISVATLLYDLYDQADDATDTGSIGFRPIYDTMVGPQRVTPAFTTIHAFAAELRPMLDANGQALLDSQLDRENVNQPLESSVNIWGSTEGNDRNGGRDVLPIYTDYTADGSTVNVCSNNDYDSSTDGNKLAEYRYLRVTIPTTATYDVNITATTLPTATADPNDRDQSDPDMYIQRNGQIVAWGLSATANSEVFTTQATLIAGATYVADVHDWRFEDADGAPPGYPATPDNNMCFDVTFTATP